MCGHWEQPEGRLGVSQGVGVSYWHDNHNGWNLISALFFSLCLIREIIGICYAQLVFFFTRMNVTPFKEKENALLIFGRLTALVY